MDRQAMPFASMRRLTLPSPYSSVGAVELADEDDEKDREVA